MIMTQRIHCFKLTVVDSVTGWLICTATDSLTVSLGCAHGQGRVYRVATAAAAAVNRQQLL